jgi:hypothetical protein
VLQVKNFLLPFLCVISGNTHAGILHFVLGYAIGSSTNGNPTQQQAQQSPLLLKSDNPGHDVILCRITETNLCGHESNGYLCTKWDGCYEPPVSPEQFAGNHGYKYIHSKSLLVLQIASSSGATNNITYFVLEVSKIP